MKTIQTIATILLAFTFCSYGQTIHVDEDFEDGNFPANWSQITNASDGGWLLGTSTSLESQYWSIAPHGNIIATNDDACDCDKSMDYLIMPVFDFSSSSTIILQFENYYDGDSEFGATEVATIEYSVDNGTNWVVLQTIVGTNDDNWSSEVVDLSALAGNSNVLVAFRYFDDNNWLFGWAIDDVLIFEPEGLDLALVSTNLPTNTNVPNDLTISGVVSNTGIDIINSFDVSWNIGGTVYTTNYNGLTMNSLETYAFSHPDLLQILQSGTYEVNINISNVNGQPNDLNADNNSIIHQVQAIEYGQIQDGGIARDYIYYHPRTAAADCPIVFVCHGYTGTAQGIMDYSNFNEIADEFGFAVCYPQGTEDGGGNTFFNVGYDFQNGETVDDVNFIENLNLHLQANNSLSDENIFCTGLSNGGDFSYLLACEASTTFKGVAPVAGLILQEIMDTCNPANEVSIFEIHGTQDNVTPFNGDPNNDDGWGSYPSIPDTIAFFNNLYNLDVVISETLNNIDPNDGSTVSSDKYSANDSCSQVWLYTVNGGGHDWPGAFGNMDISASREIWLFFEQLCRNSLSIEDQFLEGNNRELLKIVDIFGRETEETKNKLLFYIYSDGTVDKKIIVE